ncbi:MAG: ParB/RepB/Spo0J family partition protein [Phycisphaerales bacterium]|nr:ParB/RepB/Spo0J family partition protein [Phycisphaerales bacterium]
MAGTPSGKEHKSRLGRGLSSLLSEPVPVPVPVPVAVAPPASPVAPSEAAVSGEAPAPMPALGVGDVSAEAVEAQDRVELVALERMTPSPYQPRRVFDERGLAELAASIKTAGVMQPILARASGEGLEIIAGERRWRAARDAGLTHVPVLVRTLTDQEAAEWSLVENLQREDLNPVDRCTALRRLFTDFGLSHGAIAERVGLDRSTVTNFIRLGELEPAILELMSTGALSAGHGKALLAVAPGVRRVDLAKRAAKEGMSVRRLEQLTGPGRSGAGASRMASGKSPAVMDMERQLREHLATEVTIESRGDGTRGTISIAFYDLDHFDRLLQALGVSASS